MTTLPFPSPPLLLGEFDDRFRVGDLAGVDVVGGLGRDTLLGGEAFNTFWGDLHTDFVLDVPVTGPFDVGFADAMRGGAAPERFVGDVRSFSNGVTGAEVTLGADRIAGRGGADEIFGDAEGRIETLPFAGAVRGGDDLLRGGAGPDALVGDAGVLSGVLQPIAAGPVAGGDDTIAGGSGRDVLRGDARLLEVALGGDDLLVGGGGDDRIYGDAQRVLSSPFGWSGRGGNDTLDGGGGDDVLYGDGVSAGIPDAIAPGFGGDDLLRGGRGNDRLFGDFRQTVRTGGDDTLAGGGGDDVMTGGAGADLFVLSAGDDRIEDFDAAAGDRVRTGRFFDDPADALAAVSDGEDGAVLTFAAPGGGRTFTLTFRGLSEGDLTADAFL